MDSPGAFGCGSPGAFLRPGHLVVVAQAFFEAWGFKRCFGSPGESVFWIHPGHLVLVAIRRGGRFYARLGSQIRRGGLGA
jgi:hypothetical protein